MGYYSEFNLTIETGSHVVGEIANVIEENTDCFWEFDIRDLQKNFNTHCVFEIKSYEPQMWYNFVEEMTNISLRFPDAFFTINRRGKDLEDAEEVRFSNGKICRRAFVPLWSKWSVWYDSPYVK